MTALPDWLVPPYGGWHFEELGAATGGYAVTGIFHDRLATSAPFPISIDLGELTA